MNDSKPRFRRWLHGAFFLALGAALVSGITMLRHREQERFGHVKIQSGLPNVALDVLDPQSSKVLQSADLITGRQLRLPIGHYQVRIRSTLPETQVYELHVPNGFTVPMRFEPDSQSGLQGLCKWRMVEPLGGYRIVPDLTGDGIRDLLAARGDDQLLALSGMDGSVIWSYSFQGAILSCESFSDVDDDGITDFMLGIQEKKNKAASGINGFAIFASPNWRPTKTIYLSGKTAKPTKFPREYWTLTPPDNVDWHKAPPEFARFVERCYSKHVGYSDDDFNTVFMPLRHEQTVAVLVFAQRYHVFIFDVASDKCVWRFASDSLPRLLGQAGPSEPPLFWADGGCFPAVTCRVAAGDKFPGDHIVLQGQGQRD